MKTVFEGKVNGIKYDTVEAYNKAITEAIKAGGDVNASSQTYTVNEDEPKASTKFEGAVNGTKYDTVEAYNKAVQEVLDKGEPLNAYTRTITSDGTELSTASVDEPEAQEEDFEFLPGVDSSDYYMDSINSDTEWSQKIVNDWDEYLHKNFELTENWVEDASDEELEAYLKDVKDVLDQIANDATANQNMITKTEAQVKEAEKQRQLVIDSLGYFGVKLNRNFVKSMDNAIKELQDKLNLLHNAEPLNKLFNTYYTELHNLLDECLSEEEEECKECEACKECKTCEEECKKCKCCDCKKDEEQPAFDPESNANSIGTNINKLIQEIFAF